MRRKFLCVSLTIVIMFLLAPRSFADQTAQTYKRDDATVSLDLKFTRKKANTLQRMFSFLDYGPNGFATGFVVGNGLVITAYHAVSGKLTDSKKVQLGFAAQDELSVEIHVGGCHASILKVDEGADLALLQICQSGKKSQTPAFQAIITKDEKLFVVARPHGNKMIRKGIFYGPYVVQGQEFKLAKIDGHDGYSGSPVYNQKAEIVGVFSGYDRSQRLAMISPGIRAKKLLEDYVAEPKP
ncbi:MAG: Trypsin-like peptidase domain [Pyrinomonadaceae bacterium]|nr:Trypsin-like peptidase domain [Pyrinomonadaceae bacterium]